MMLSVTLAATAAVVVVLGPLLVLAYLAIHFGVDSRPGIGEHDGRPWLWRGPLR
jgi:hypothetical protein